MTDHTYEQVLRAARAQYKLDPHGYHSPTPTVGTCWDADRLDLGRVGVEPDPRFMSTAVGKLPYTLQWATEVEMAEGVYGW